MFIPLEGDNAICLCDVVAIYKTDEGTEILKRDGSVVKTGFTPPTLRKRQLTWIKRIRPTEGANE